MAKKKEAKKKKKKPPIEEQGLPSLSLVFGYMAVKELRLLEDRVAVLSRLGFGNPEIATICGTTTATVATLKAKVKRSKRR